MSPRSALRAPAAAAVDGLLTLLYPDRCLLCDELGTPAVCPECIAAIVTPIPQPQCELCGHPAAQSPCSRCRDDRPLFEYARAVGLYEGGMRRAIHMLKFHDRPMLAGPLGAAMAEYVRSIPHRFGELKLDAVAPVPMERRRQRQRGYNQAERLARVVAAELSLAMRPNFLRRRGRTRPQVGLGHAQRLANLEQAFEADPGCDGMRILLVDDVSTTGATQRACAAALKSAGAKAVYCLALAGE